MQTEDIIDITSSLDDLPQRLDSFLKCSHPRLIIPAGGIPAGSQMERRVRALLPFADKALDAPPFERVWDTSRRRILLVSRTAVTHITSLALVWLLTGERKYFVRAEKDLLAVCAFEDWNPNHFLDTAEMMLAVSLGYDWLYNDLSEDSRTRIADSLYRLGLATALPSTPQDWMTRKNNWPQVCYGGATAAALALAPHHREDSLAVLRNAFTNFHLPLDSYAPDGVYIEGPAYWGYGTQYTIIFLMLIERSLGTSYGIADKKYFADSLDFIFHAIGASGLYFNFADCHRTRGNAAAFPWFCERYGKKLPANMPIIRELIETPEQLANRCWLYPVVTALACDENKYLSDENHLSLDWHGRSDSEILTMRSDWTPQAWYVGIKAGTPQIPHGHMDVGSFVVDAFGERWAEDPDMENYSLIESKGFGFWDARQEGERWRVFRCGIQGHNIPCIDEQRQLVQGRATIEINGLGGNRPQAMLDLSEIYGFPIRREFLFANRSSLTITDTLGDFPVGANYRWQMLTQAEVCICELGLLKLSQNGKSIYLKNNLDLPWEVIEVEKLLAPWDSPLSGMRRISFGIPLPAASQQKEFSVTVEITALP